MLNGTLDTDNLEERLVQKFISLDAEVKKLAVQMDLKKKELEDTEAELIDLLNDENKKSSARFKGLGHVTCLDATVKSAYILEGQEEVLFDYLRNVADRADLIKTGVHHTSLGAFINQRLKANEEPPPGVGYKLVQKLRAYPEK